GDQHTDLVGYLDTMGTRELFGRVYGSDLLNVWKAGPAYYRAILADIETDPATALVIDDSDRAIAWAGECGVRGVLVRRHDREEVPHQAPAPIRRVDEHVEKTGAAFRPRRSRDRESDKSRAVPARHHHGVAVRRLPPHLALGERPRAPLLALELEHSWAELPPRSRIERDCLDRRRHQRLVIPT